MTHRFMEEGESKEHIYRTARDQHAMRDRRLQMLFKKPYLTAEEELEVKVLKKKKLYFKDVMDTLSEELKKGEDT